MTNNLKKIRERKGLTLLDLTKATSFAGSTLSRMENGKQYIYDQQAIVLADYLNVSIDYLLGREFHEKEKIVYKENTINYSVVLSKINGFSNKELLLLAGAIDYILEERSKISPNPQAVKNEIDKIIRKNTS